MYVYEHYLETHNKYLLIDLFSLELISAIHHLRHNLNETSNTLRQKRHNVCYTSQQNIQKTKITKEEIQEANTHLKRCSKLLIREMQSNNEILFPFQIC